MRSPGPGPHLRPGARLHVALRVALRHRMWATASAQLPSWAHQEVAYSSFNRVSLGSAPHEESAPFLLCLENHFFHTTQSHSHFQRRQRVCRHRHPGCRAAAPHSLCRKLLSLGSLGNCPAALEGGRWGVCGHSKGQGPGV